MIVETKKDYQKPFVKTKWKKSDTLFPSPDRIYSFNVQSVDEYLQEFL
jgi:hypothetical protein